MNKVELLIEMINSGQQPVIRFLKEEEYFDYEIGMLTRCISVNKDYDDGEEIVWMINTNFSEFKEYNKQLEKPIWIKGDKRVCYSESSFYKLEHPYFVSNASEGEFEIVDGVCSLFDEYKMSGESSYVKWLEQQVLKLRGE